MRMGNSRSRWLPILAALLAWAAFSVHAGELREIRLENGATGTRAEIRLQGAGEFKTFSLAGPNRLVVDLPAATVARGLALPAGAGVVTAIRRGQPVAGTVRIVFDLATAVAPLGPRMESVAGGALLVIEWPGDGTAVAAAPAAPAARTAAVAAPVVAASATSTPASAPAGATAVAAATNASGLSPQAILEARSVPGPAVAQPTPAVVASHVPAATVASAPPSQAVAVVPDLARQAGLRPLVVAIDAGHGGQDPGAIGPTGNYEKNVTLAMAKELARQVNATPGLKAYLVRDRDVFIPLNQRAARARAAKADIFVSLHADAAENRKARGSSVYVLSLKGASSQRARWLADKENASDLIGGVSLEKVDNTLSSVLLDLAQSGHMKASEDAADQVLGGLKRVGNNHKPGIERANFAVLRTADMPAMLVETAFISNPEEEKRLIDPAFQRKVAAAVLDGVQTYFTRQPPPGTLFAARAQAEQLAAASATARNSTAGVP